jgi:hypothetical protein
MFVYFTKNLALTHTLPVTYHRTAGEALGIGPFRIPKPGYATIHIVRVEYPIGTSWLAEPLALNNELLAAKVRIGFVTV